MYYGTIVQTTYVRQTSDGTRPSPHRCDITQEWNPSFVWARVNLNKVVKHLMGLNQVLIDVASHWGVSYFVYIHLR